MLTWFPVRRCTTCRPWANGIVLVAAFYRYQSCLGLSSSERHRFMVNCPSHRRTGSSSMPFKSQLKSRHALAPSYMMHRFGRQ
ncbi:hypothetical protein BD311DRAFT_765407 [Dichomitus squalens]|uniref:Uncharacterized protein n=1 Tax=Dichomitus squalens TaxID=114155 RepID=A0A4Q9MG19_9APHY|nr:hypothetical protein BD311DRAFT_765407 [Dichomitus squalens]